MERQGFIINNLKIEKDIVTPEIDPLAPINENAESEI